LLTFEFKPFLDVDDVFCPERRHVDAHEADLIKLVFLIKNVNEGDELAELEIVVEPDVVLFGLILDRNLLVVSSNFFARVSDRRHVGGQQGSEGLEKLLNEGLDAVDGLHIADIAVEGVDGVKRNSFRRSVECTLA
jgi:hypothetical protein